MTQRTILVVDDSRWVAGGLDSLLGPFGYRVVHAPNGGAALTVAQATRPDLVIVDVKRRVFKTIGVIRELRRDPHLRKIPAILWSAVYQPHEIKSFADDCEPFTARKKFDRPDELLSLVESLMR